MNESDVRKIANEEIRKKGSDCFMEVAIVLTVIFILYSASVEFNGIRARLDALESQKPASEKHIRHE